MKKRSELVLKAGFKSNRRNPQKVTITNNSAVHHEEHGSISARSRESIFIVIRHFFCKLEILFFSLPLFLIREKSSYYLRWLPTVS